MSDILEQNPALLDAVHADLETGEKKLKRNVEGVSSETVLRLLVVPQVENLSFRDLMLRSGDSWMRRCFVHVYDDPLLDFTTFNKLANGIQPATWEKLNEMLVRFARDKGAKGEKLRLDTTAVETDVHDPTDSSLLLDSVRVLCRLLARVRELNPAVAGTQRARVKHAKRLAFRTGMEARGKQHQARMKSLYARLLETTERTRHWTDEVVARMEKHVPQEQAARLRWKELRKELQHFSALTSQCILQCRERTQNGQAVPNTEKIFSIFEPHTELLKRGKAGNGVRSAQLFATPP
jgi:IS5 family transposase